MCELEQIEVWFHRSMSLWSDDSSSKCSIHAPEPSFVLPVALSATPELSEGDISCALCANSSIYDWNRSFVELNSMLAKTLTAG